MHKHLAKYIFSWLLFSTITLCGQQEVVKYPVRFSQYYNAFAIINPAAAGAYADVELAMGNQRLLGNFSNISTYYLNANLRLPRKNIYRPTPFSVVGLYVYNDREGKYLNRTRFYASYVWHANISRKMMMSGGFYVGAMNYSVKGTALSGSGSDFAPDGIIGFRLYNEAFHFGVSYNQIFNSQIQPLMEVANLPPFLNFTGGFNYFVHHSLIIQPVYSVLAPVNGDKLLADLSVIAAYKRNLRFILGVHNNNKFITSVEFRNLMDLEHGLNVALTYSFPLVNTGLTTNFIELGVSFHLNNSKY